MFTNGSYLNQQKFTDNNLDYINQYFDLVYNYYSNWSLSNVKVTYYNFDIENSVIDQGKLNAGSFEMVGDKSGYRWRKILDFPLNGLSVMNTTPVNDEKGTTNSERILDAYFPRTAGIVPKVHDFIAFDEFNVNNRHILNDPPLYEVVNVEKSNDFELAFYKINMKVSYVTKSRINLQLNDILDFVDYEKKLYGIDQAIILQKLLEQRSRNKLKECFDSKCGLYCETIQLED